MQDRSGSMQPGAMGMPFGNPQVMLQQQNANMEALERRNQRERDRSGSVAGVRPTFNYTAFRHLNHSHRGRHHIHNNRHVSKKTKSMVSCRLLE